MVGGWGLVCRQGAAGHDVAGAGTRGTEKRMGPSAWQDRSTTNTSEDGKNPSVPQLVQSDAGVVVSIHAARGGGRVRLTSTRHPWGSSHLRHAVRPPPSRRRSVSAQTVVVGDRRPRRSRVGQSARPVRNVRRQRHRGVCWRSLQRAQSAATFCRRGLFSSAHRTVFGRRPSRVSS